MTVDAEQLRQLATRALELRARKSVALELSNAELAFTRAATPQVVLELLDLVVGDVRSTPQRRIVRAALRLERAERKKDDSAMAEALSAIVAEARVLAEGRT